MHTMSADIFAHSWIKTDLERERWGGAFYKKRLPIPLRKNLWQYKTDTSCVFFICLQLLYFRVTINITKVKEFFYETYFEKCNCIIGFDIGYVFVICRRTFGLD